MATAISDVLQSLTDALRLTNIAIDPAASPRTRRLAVRALHRAMRKTAEANSLWDELTLRAVSASPDNAATDALLQAIGDLLTERQAALLVATGYRTPPPPPAYALIDQIYSVVHSSNIPPGGSGRQIELARSAVRQFVEQLAGHLPAAEDRLLKRAVGFGRIAGITTAMAALLAVVQVKTGDEFEISVGTSMDRWFSVEVTIPVSWGEPSQVKAVALSITTQNLIDTLSTLDFGVSDVVSEDVKSTTRKQNPGKQSALRLRGAGDSESQADESNLSDFVYLEGVGGPSDQLVDASRYRMMFEELGFASRTRDDVLHELQNAIWRLDGSVQRSDDTDDSDTDHSAKEISDDGDHT